MKRLIIVDVSNFIFRAFFAIRPLHAADGTPVNAVYGVLSSIYNLITKYEPTHIVIARDTKEGSYRKDIYPEYKANRSEPPDELIPQFALIENLVDLLKLPAIAMPGFEADDIIGSLATQFKDQFDEILIASGDKDLMQFVDGPIKMLDTMKEKTYSREDVLDKMGVYPEQIVDYLSLVGDTSDNIPGVPGIGAKGAANLLAEYQNLETIILNKDKIKNKRTQTALLENEEKAHLSKSLVKITTDLKLPFKERDMVYSLTASGELVAFLEKMNFKSWLTKLSAYKTADVVAAKPQKEVKDLKIVNITKLSELTKCLENKTTSVRIEWTTPEDQLSGIKSLMFYQGESVYNIFFSDADFKQEDFFKTLATHEAVVVSDNMKSLLQTASLSGTLIKNYFDITQGHFLINPERKHDLETLIEEYLGIKIEIPEGQADLFAAASEEDQKTNAKFVEAIFDIYPVMTEKLKELKVTKPYFELDLPLLNVLAKMELVGVNLDVPFYHSLEKEFASQLESIQKEIFAAAGDEINLRSPKQVGELLFEKLGLPVIRKTKTGYSTDAEVLAELVSMDISPIPALLLKYRELEKLLSTYVKTLPLIINPKTKKIHTHFQLSNAATGRLSSDHPNLQNIPVRTENGRRLRQGFVASNGRTLLSADYSQVELRILAHFSQDPNMLFAFKNDKDIHKQTASEIFDIPMEKLTKEERNSAKAINFGLMYGQTSFGLSQSLRISQGEAKKYITSYFEKFSRVKGYLDGLREKCEETGYAETLFERKRFLPDIKSTNRQIKAMAERVAINSPIQGTAADIIKLAMINIDKRLTKENLKSEMILQVHDELIFDVFPEELEAMKVLVRDEMENAVQLSVPLKVDMGIGENWFDLK